MNASTDLNREFRPEPSLYEICYLDAAGRVIAVESVRCESEKAARILAHALRPAGMRRLEVWHGPSLVYERPAGARLAGLAAVATLPRLFAAE